MFEIILTPVPLRQPFENHTETVSRWMTGLAIQNRALDTLMRMDFAFPAVRQTLGKAGSLDMSNRDRVNKIVHRAKA